MNFTLHVWRQSSKDAPGKMVVYEARDISPDSSFIEMIDIVNSELAEKGQDPIAYEADCLEGICGSCCMTINGLPHGPGRGATTCQLHMRSFEDGQHIFIEPFRSAAFPLIKDLMIDRSSFDRIIQAGGFISVNTGGPQDANNIPIAKQEADLAFDAAQCIGCGACVAGCKNGAAMLFTAAKVAQLAHLPQGQPERYRRVIRMVESMDKEGFGGCTNQYECEAVCPKEISVRYIAEMNRDFIKAKLCK